MGNKFDVTDNIDLFPVSSRSEEIPANDPLWDLLREGDSKAFEKIFRTHYPMLLNYGLKFSPNQEEIQDCIQSLFLTIWERKANLGPSTSVNNYLLASLRRLLLKRLKNNSSLVSLDMDSLDFYIELSVETAMIHDQTLVENIQSIQKAVTCLPARQREALYLKFYKDQSFAEVATVMNISTRAVYKLIYKALDALGGELTPQSPSKTTFRSNLNLLHIPGLYLIHNVIFYA